LDILIYNKQQQLDFQTTENQRLNLMCEEKDRNNIKITSQLKNLSTDLSQAKENVIVKEDQQREQIDNIWGQLLREQTEKEKIRKQLTSEIEKLSKELHNERKEKSHIDNLFTTQGRGQQELAEKLEKSQQEKDRIISSLESNLRQQQINFNQLNNKINELNLQLKDKDGLIQDQQNLIDPLRRELREIQENNALVNKSELLHVKEELDNEKDALVNKSELLHVKEELDNEKKENKLNVQKLRDLLKEKDEELNEFRPKEKVSKKKKRDSDEEDDYKRSKRVYRKDPEKMTVKDLKSAITHAGKAHVLPPHKTTKAEYVSLYRKYVNE